MISSVEVVREVQAAIVNMCLDEGFSEPAVARKFKRAPDTVRRILRRYVHEHPDEPRVKDYLEKKEKGKLKKGMDPRRRELRRPISTVHGAIGVRVARYCARENLNNTQFGLLCGLSRIRVGELMCGSYDVELSIIQRIAHILEEDVLTLMSRLEATRAR